MPPRRPLNPSPQLRDCRTSRATSWRSLCFLLMLQVVSRPVLAAPLPVNNPGFEANFVPDGQFNDTFTPTGWTLYDPFGIIGSQFNSRGVLNPTGTGLYPAGAPEGRNVALVFLWPQNQSQDNRPAGFTQTLASTVQANTVYTLTVQVGNIAAIENPPYDLNGFPGYQVQLLANGAMVAQDDDLLFPAEGTFELSTVQFTTGATPAQLGQTLAIRLINLNRPDSGIEVNFDDIRLDASAVGSPTLTPGPSATGSPTRSPTRTATATASRTSTNSPSPSASASPTATRTLTATAGPSLSPSVSPTATRTATSSPTRTATAGATSTVTATPSPTRSATSGASALPSASSTASASPITSSTGTPSPTRTATTTATVSPSASTTGTPSPSRTPSSSPVFSPSRTQTPTRTSTGIPSFTPTPSLGASPTTTSTAAVNGVPSTTGSVLAVAVLLLLALGLRGLPAGRSPRSSAPERVTR